MKKFGEKIKGFTLVELMVVIVILGVLSALAINRYRVMTMKTKIQEAVIFIRHLQELEEAYYAENGVLPHQDGTPLFIINSDWGRTLFSRFPWWKSFTDRIQARLRELGVDQPSGKTRFWYYLAWWGGGDATKIIYAYPKRVGDIWGFTAADVDDQLKDVFVAIDNDGSIYVWGVPGMEWWH